MKNLKKIIFFVTLLILCFLISANVDKFDYDLWARLIAGMGVLDGHSVLKTDFVSYTPTHIWWDHEYGSGIVFYYFLKHFGAYSLIILQTLICFFIFFTINKIIKLRGIKEPYNLIFWLFPVIAVAQNFGNPIRCHLFSFLFFTIFLYILEKSRRDNPKLLYILPILTIIWNNLHGGVVSGLGLIAIYFIGDLIRKKPIKHYIYAGLLSAASLIINPWGWEYIKFLLMANTMKRPDVAEWWGIFSEHQIRNQIPFKIFLFIIISIEAFVIARYKKSKKIMQDIDITKWLVLLITVYLAISHVKLLPFFVITGTAFCYEDFKNYIEIKFPNWTHNLVAILILLIGTLSLCIKTYEIPLGASAYPHREVEFIKLNKIEGNILVNFGLGSFVSYKLYPQNKIFMDGRYEEVYYDEMVPLLKNFYLLKSNWDDVLKKYPPDIMIIEKDYPVYLMLNKKTEWKNVYETERFIVYLKNTKTQKSYIQPSNDIGYYKNTLFDTSIKF